MPAPPAITHHQVVIADDLLSQSVLSQQDMYDQMMLTHMKKWMTKSTTSGGTKIAWTTATTSSTNPTVYADNTMIYSNSVKIVSNPNLIVKSKPQKIRITDDVDIDWDPVGIFLNYDKDGRIQLAAGMKLVAPDGAEIVVDAAGNYVVNDKDAKVVYRANRSRDFNRYINASDLLEEFLRYLRSMGVKRKDVMKVDLGVFISWLIIAAAEADQIDKPQEEVLMIEHHVKKTKLTPKCKCCAKFIPKRNAEAGVFFCNGAEMDRYREKIAA